MGVNNKVTKEEVKIICDLYTNNQLSLKEIAKESNRSETTVRTILYDNNIMSRKYKHVSKEEENNILNDYANKMTIQELVQKYNRSKETIISILTKHDVYIQPPSNKLSDKDWKIISGLYMEGENEKIFSLYPHLTYHFLMSKMSRLKVKSGRRNWWSEEDKQIISDLYYIEDIDTLYELISRRHSKDAIQTFALKELGYSIKNYWTEEEDNLLKENYSTRPIEEVLELFPNRTLMALQNRAKKFGLTSNYRVNTYWPEEDNDFLINHWKDMSDYQIGAQLNRTPSSVKDRRKLLGLYRINKEFFGYETIKRLLRARTWIWKQKSMEACNHCCVITGSKDFHIHHLYGFSDIFNQFITINNITEQKIKAYTFEELENMCDEFVKFHDTYPLGVCVRSDLHQLFHELYGKHNNNPNQWNDFIDYIKEHKIA